MFETWRNDRGTETGAGKGTMWVQAKLGVIPCDITVLPSGFPSLWAKLQCSHSCQQYKYNGVQLRDTRSRSWATNIQRWSHYSNSPLYRITFQGILPRTELPYCSQAPKNCPLDWMNNEECRNFRCCIPRHVIDIALKFPYSKCDKMADQTRNGGLICYKALHDHVVGASQKKLTDEYTTFLEWRLTEKNRGIRRE
jgi:hypothetical protein